jgi:hypothetical protein
VRSDLVTGFPVLMHAQWVANRNATLLVAVRLEKLQIIGHVNKSRQWYEF